MDLLYKTITLTAWIIRTRKWKKKHNNNILFVYQIVNKRNKTNKGKQKQVVPASTQHNSCLKKQLSSTFSSESVLIKSQIHN